VKAEFDNSSLLSPFAEGGFRYAAEGEYIQGRRKGQKAVCKWFKKGHVSGDKYFDHDIRAMEKGEELVAMWNEAGIIHQHIRVNVPEVWNFSKSDFFEMTPKCSWNHTLRTTKNSIRTQDGMIPPIFGLRLCRP
jgi:hypothetical protein